VKFEVSRSDAEVFVEDNPAVNFAVLKSSSDTGGSLVTPTTLTPQQQQQQQLAIESLLCEH
jgi:hypothetical protein